MEQIQEEVLSYFKEQLLKMLQVEEQNQAACLALIESIEKTYEEKTITLIF